MCVFCFVCVGNLWFLLGLNDFGVVVFVLWGEMFWGFGEVWEGGSGVEEDEEEGDSEC